MEKNFSPLEREIYNLTGLETKREYRFHPTREWRFDFAIPAVRVAIEVEGGVWNGGRHFRPEGYLRDMEKYNEAAACGWLVIRVICGIWKSITRQPLAAGLLYEPFHPNYCG